MDCLVDCSQRNLKNTKQPRGKQQDSGAASRRERAPFVPLALVSFAPSRFANVANVGPAASLGPGESACLSSGESAI